MLALALAALLALGPGSGAADPELDPLRPDAPDRPGPDPRDPCGGREGWVGDGDDGRAAPACDRADTDRDDDPGGLREPDWLRTGAGGEEDAPP